MGAVGGGENLMISLDYLSWTKLSELAFAHPFAWCYLSDYPGLKVRWHPQRSAKLEWEFGTVR